MNRELDFQHRQAAHCESGVAASLVSHIGIPLSEPMAFGIGGGLFFGYFPFIRLNGLPLVTYRVAVGRIIKRLTQNLGLGTWQRTFRHPAQAMAALDDLLAQGVPVGLQTGVFWLPYFPKAYRFHFNGHNLVVYGKRGDDYLISDPVFPGPVTCPAEDLQRARFAAGALAPKGRMYGLNPLAAKPDFRTGIKAGLQVVVRGMLQPFPLTGVRGIRFLARRLKRWPQRLGPAKAELHLGHVVRMQEEIGTGGGGFRFLYADFLREAGELLRHDPLAAVGRDLTVAGDRWRDFAVMAARICKGRPAAGDDYQALADGLEQCAALEEQFFRRLRTLLGTLP
ncbi:BtrH N-terminal domain-containing protein [Desulfurivibrio dismutans]|uniref:BtrH N-terminal domain-containing protein n=1 Tax=Desulfurivibrio dismutans TaxID=1398908 RepID=UPI0023DBE058|nr:BtrH N-terminal domain-containing protein [Desulfurivibrio alkaliphilus]MDF1614708.1 BtrH N-terminal domain-containing protein [Desulfurivibrio alkaliphilus]